MQILDKDQIETMDLAECDETLAKIYKDKLLEKTIDKTHPYWDQIDAISNTICYLEDRAHYLRQVYNLEKANATRWGRTVAETPQIPPPDDMDD